MSGDPSPDVAHHQRLRAILLEAAAVVGDERERILREACRGDDALRREVEDLLTGVGVSTSELLPPAPPIALTAPATIGPYRIERRLGAGGMGTVYAARAPATGARVALKVLHPHLVSSEHRRRFLREAEVGARVRHPGVVRTLDVGSDQLGDQEVLYLVMEHVVGRTLAALRRAWGTIPEALLREIAAQAADGLAAIHAADIVHRDLKPENLMLTDDHRLRIMDLGIARRTLGASRLTSTGHFIGSLLYAAPEQVAGRDVGPGADLYALGVVLYELASGANPFERAVPAAALWTRLTITPPRLPGAHGISPFFSGLVDALLQHDPARRLPSAAALGRCLEEGEGGAWWRERGTREAPRCLVRHDTPLRGRADALATLEDAWARALGGEAVTLQVVGESGLGKTRLLSEFVARRRTEDLEVLVATGAGGLAEALASRLAEADGRALLERALVDHPAWRASFAAWLAREIPPADGPRLDLDALAALMLRVLATLGSERSVVLILDDLDEAGREDLDLAVRTLRGAAGVRLLTLVGTSQPLARLAADVPRSETVALSRLSTAEAVALVVDVLGPGEPAAALAARVAALGQGVPLFLLDLARGLDATEGERLQPSASLRDQVQHRLGQLTPEETEVLELAAVAGRVFDADPLARIRGWTRLRLLATLGRLERRHGLVRSDAARFRFDHPLVHEIVYQGVAPALRREIHRLLAEARLPAAGDDVEALAPQVVVEVVHHQLRSSEPERAVARLGRAISQLEGTFQTDRLVDTLERALALEGIDVTDRMQWSMALARTLVRQGRTEAARAAWQRTVAEADAHGTVAHRAEARVGLGALHVRVGRYERARRRLEEARDLLGRAGPPRMRATTLGWIGQYHWHRGAYAEAEAAQREVIRITESAGLSLLMARAQADLAILMHETGRLEEAEDLTQRSLACLRETGDRTSEATVSSNLGNVQFDSGRLLAALASYEKSIALCRELALRSGEAVGLLNLALACVRLGETARAESRLNEALAICRYADLKRIEGYVRHGLGILGLARGDIGAAERHLHLALGLRDELGDRRGAADTEQLLGAAAEAAGDVERALGHLEAALGAARESGELNAEVLALARRAVLTEAGGAEAAARFDEVAARLRYTTRLEGSYLLWLATGERARLETARGMLDAERARLPAERHAAFVDGLRLHAAIVNA